MSLLLKILTLSASIIPQIRGDLYISTAQEFLTFSQEVTSGTNTYANETVYVTDDLDFKGLKFEPAGIYYGDLDYSTSFLGSFNGNGHLIKNIHYEDNSRWDVAFIAVANGNVTLENVIIDSSCLFNNTYEKEFSSTAGAFGYVSCDDGIMHIRNSINLGGVVYGGSDDSPTLGNVVAYMESYVEVSNCVGAGWTISKTLGFAGGVVGYSMGQSYAGYAQIENCFWDIDTYILNGLALKIATNIDNMHPYNTFQQVIQSLSYGHNKNNFVDIIDTSDEPVFATDTDEGNDEEEEERKKLMYNYIDDAPTVLEVLKKNAPEGITFPTIILNTMGGKEVKPLLRTVVKELPVPTREGHNFAGWYNSPAYTTSFSLNKESDSIGYARWTIGTYYAIFEMNIGDGDPRLDPIPVKYKESIPLPSPKKKNYNFIAWCRTQSCTRLDEMIDPSATFPMPGYNITFYPKWKESQNSGNKALIIAIAVCAVAVVIAVVIAVATIMLYGKQRNKRVIPGMTVLPDGTITLDSGYFLASNIDLSGSTHVKLLSSFPLQPDVESLKFNDDKILNLDIPYQIKFTMKNVSKTKLNWEIFPGNVDKYTLIFNPDRGILSKNETVKIVAQITMNCTSNLETMVPILTWEESADKEYRINCKHTFIKLHAESEHSARLDPDEIKLIQPAVGEGGFGAVFKGYYKSQVVAVKVLKNQKWGGKARELVREVKLMKDLHNNYIANLIGAVTFPGKMCLVTDFVPYGNLGALLSSGNLSRGLKARIVFDAARGIRYLHQCNIIHRDIKPANFLVESLDFMSPVCCKLSDFGTSKLIETYSSKKKKRMSSRIGTPIYMAPEMLETDYYSFPVDVFGFGISLHEIYTEKEPYSELGLKHLWDITEFVIAGNRMDIPDTVPYQISEVIKKCWAQKPEKRPKIETVVELLKTFYADVVHEIRPDLEIEDEENEAEGFDKIEQKVGGDEEHKKSKKKSDKKSIELENLE